MTTQTYEGQTKVTTRGVVVGKIRQLETALEMYEQDPFWDFHKKAGAGK